MEIYVRFKNQLINLISFSHSIREIAEVLNRKIEERSKPPKDIGSHPGGFCRGLNLRRLSIAESYIQIIHELESVHHELRVNALRNLVNQSFHAKTMRMPLNTARVQVALMKEAVKNKNNPRRQLELLTDFSLASYGQGQVIRKLCKKLKIIEVPENGKDLCDLKMGFDSHVHDNLTEGRKTPSQMLLDAFIKGISELTIAYYMLPDRFL